jgi:hypothetical protein
MAAPAAYGQLTDAKGQLISPIAFSNTQAITTSFVQTPIVTPQNYNSSSGTTNRPPQWLKVEFQFGTTAALKPDYPYLDAVEFKIWIEGLDLYAKDAPVPGKGVAVGLTGSVTYVNIASGKNLYGVFYVHPSTLARYSSGRGYADFDQKFNIHIEAYVGGVLMDAIDKRKDPMGTDWYKSLRAIPSLVYRQDQCPFIMTDPDRYPAIKLPVEESGTGTGQ